MTRAKSKRPAPPEHLADEALLEWHRIVDELDSAGRIDKTDRALLSIYVETWAVHYEASRRVAEHGAVIKYSNGVVGQSPFYKTQRETAAQLRGLLNDMGLTPTARGKAPSTEEDDNLNF
jgi:P27 family predicted phage terminase small subunit